MTATATDAISRTWTCLCGGFKGQVTGDPALAVYCHCLQCRRYASTAMQLAAFAPEQFFILKENEKEPLIRYESSPGVVRHSCGTCGAFAHCPLGIARVGTAQVTLVATYLGKTLMLLNCRLFRSKDGPTLKPSAHIFVAHKGTQDIPFPELPQYDEFP